MDQQTTLTIDRRKIIEFFDEKPDWSTTHSTSVVALLSEDLAAATFQHCMEKHLACNVTIRPELVGTGGIRGPRLDRWIEVDRPCEPEQILFQTEIKHLSAHATGAKPLKLLASAKEVEDYKHERWMNQWDPDQQTLRWDGAAKVLVPMKPPDGTEHRCHLPLLIYWTPIAPIPEQLHKKRVPGGHLFSVPNPRVGFEFNTTSPPIPDRPFPDLWIFSISSYLRSLEERELPLKMPDAAARLHALRRLVRTPDQTPTPGACDSRGRKTE